MDYLNRKLTVPPRLAPKESKVLSSKISHGVGRLGHRKLQNIYERNKSQVETHPELMNWDT